jgi:hypothetical protein
MSKLNIYNKLFIAFFALLVVVIIWKVPHEKNAPAANVKQSSVNMGR